MLVSLQDGKAGKGNATFMFSLYSLWGSNNYHISNYDMFYEWNFSDNFPASKHKSFETQRKEALAELESQDTIGFEDM